MISHRERLQVCLRGQETDRPAVALWRHFPVDDQHPGSLAAATLQFQATFDFDLVKVTPASSFCLKDWGVQDEWHGDPEGTRDYTTRVVSQPQDWEALPNLDLSAPHLSAQLACLRLLRARLGPHVPMLQTIFSPLAQAKNLVGGDRLIEHIRHFPEAVLKGLQIVTGTTRRFTEAALQAGADGVFYAIQHAQAALLTPEEYQTFGMPFDRQVMAPADQSWCNMLHLHGHAVYFELANQLPVQIVNWHDRETPPSLAEALGRYAGVLCGGLRQDTLVLQDASQVEAEAVDALRQTGGRRFLLSTGCIVPIIAPYGNLVAARRSVEPAWVAGNGAEP